MAATFVPATSGEEFALWLAKNQPDLFLKMLKAAQGGKLAGLTDVLASIGSGLSTAAKAVGSFAVSKEGATTIASLGAVYLTTRQQKAALNTQVQLAQLGQSPAPIAMPPGMQPILSSAPVSPVTGIPTASGTLQNFQPIPYTPEVGQQLVTTAAFKAYAPWALAVGGVFLALFAFRRK